MESGWKRNSAETKTIRAQGEQFGMRDLIARSAAQVERAAKDDKFVTVVIGAGHRDRILAAPNDDAKIETARRIAHDNPHLTPDTMDEDEKAAFLVALAQELTKPQYKQ